MSLNTNLLQAFSRLVFFNKVHAKLLHGHFLFTITHILLYSMTVNVTNIKTSVTN